MARRNVVYVLEHGRNWRGWFALVIGLVTFVACISMDWSVILSAGLGFVAGGLCYGRRK